MDLSSADAPVLERLFAGDKVRLSEAFSADPTAADAARKAASGLARRLLVFDEEQGIDVGRVAVGILQVKVPSSARTPGSLLPVLSPLLLWRVTLRSLGAGQGDYTMQLREEAEPNPVLLYVLGQHFGVDHAGLGDKLGELVAGAGPETGPLDLARRCSEALHSELDRPNVSFELHERIVLGAFSFEKMPMVDDLNDHPELLASHDVIAALALDEEAARAVTVGVGRLPQTDGIPPQQEFLVHDADSTQQAAVEAALAGRHLVIDGPPGTGKSQTIANIIASMAARGKRVLFVAEKRAAIEAVTDRLAQVGLGRLVFDLHEQRLDKRRLAQQLGAALEEASQQSPVEVVQLHTRLGMRRDQVGEYCHQLHRAREPWAVSAYEVQCALLGLPRSAHTRFRFSASGILRLDPGARLQTEDALSELAGGEGFRFYRGESPWAGSPIRSEREVREALDRLTEINSGLLTSARGQLEQLVKEAKLRRPQSLEEWRGLLALLRDVNGTISLLSASVYGPELDDLVWATGDRAWRQAQPRGHGFLARRRLVRRARSLGTFAPADRAALHRALRRAQDQRRRWSAIASDDGTPSRVPGLEATVKEFERLQTELAALAANAALPDLAAGTEQELDRQLNELEDTRRELLGVPRINRLLDDLTERGLRPLMEELSRKDRDGPAVIAAFRWAWYSSILDQIRIASPILAAFNGAHHWQAVQAFQGDDREHLDRNADRVRREVAVRIKSARDAHPDQDQLIRDQAVRKARHLPVRRLVHQAPDVLLSVYPCWAMSPLVVSRTLPAERLFDLVIFDEASQVEPESALPAIMRARQVIVAGDDKQLPPSDYFRKYGLGQDDEESDEDEALTVYESILGRLQGLLGSHQRYRLRWHYRSLDERLISFSNTEIYGGDLVTFPGTGVDAPVRLAIVDGTAVIGQDGSAPEEVAEVVRLALEQATRQPGETLGVITMGTKHAERIDKALRKALLDRPELSAFFSDQRGPGRRFFVKSIEQVQGDERDHIIFSVSYARKPDGRAPGNLGPLNHEGGERRLNVAVTRARRSMTVVSTFTHHDMPPSGYTHQGPALLRRFLEFAERGGRAEDLSGPTGYTQLNPFEEDVLAGLRKAGIPAEPQWGVGAYRIDFALAHPQHPGRFVLAVEADGRTYHTGASARDRDRLRQQHLEGLGWQFYRLWSTSWFDDPQAELAKITAAWDRACAGDDGQRSRPAAATAAPAASQPETSSFERERPAADPTAARGPRPFTPGLRKIAAYSDADLRQACRWLLRDGLPLPREDRLRQAMAELGLSRTGPVITRRLTQAILDAELDGQEEISR